MPIQKKYFNEEILLKQLEAEKLTGEQIALILENEIDRSENLKIMLVEEMTENKEATVRIVNDLDSYIFNIQAILVDMQADRYTREVLSTDRMKQVRGKILEILDKGSL